jgi:ribose transport system permease protein
MTVVADAAAEGGGTAGTPRSDPSAPVGRSRSRELMLEFTERYALVVLFVATFIFFSVWSKTSSTFPHSTNIKNVLGGEAYSGILALAIMIPLVCGEFDFSVGNSAGLVQVLVAGFMARLMLPVPLAIILPIGIGAFIGLSNGNTVARIGVNSLIVTLGISSVLLGIVQWYTNGQSISNHISPWLTNIATDTWFGLPVTLYILAIAALVVYYLLEHTPYGRYLYSIGSNREAARLVGLRVERYVLFAFVLSGTLAGVAGVLLVANSGGGNPQAGQIIDTLQALAAAYLGATAIKPGRFNVLGTMIAIYFLAFTVTGLSLAGVADWINSVFDGGALFVAVLVSTIIGRRRAGTS